MPLTPHLRWITCALAALLLMGCPAPAPPTAMPVSPLPATAALPTSLPPVPASPTPLLPTPAPAGWIEQQTDALAIWLPGDWKAIDFAAGDAQAVYDELQARDPDLAAIIGSADALQDAAFWAFRNVDAASFADNLNIRRTPLGGQRIEAMQAVIDPIVAQYQQLGFQVADAAADLNIGGLPAGRIAFSFEVGARGDQDASIHGRQYLVATDADLWILSYSANAASITELAPVFEQSALSFRVK